ncbi:MAG: phage major capsid domain-containing protein, partial [Candidatus Fonsibacter sp.]
TTTNHEDRGRSRKYMQSTTAFRASPIITDTNIYETFEVTEPLLLSPFIFGSGHGKQGFYGVQSMKLSDGHEWKRESRMADCSPIL